MPIGETGTQYTAPEKGPARSTSADWKEPDTHPLTDDKSGGEGAVENVKAAIRQIKNI